MAYEIQPSSYEELIALKGLGPKRIRALALISELIHGASPSWIDPAKFSFAHGGKDCTPFPVDRATYDNTIQTLHEAIEEAKLEKKDRYNAIKRLEQYANWISYLPSHYNYVKYCLIYLKNVYLGSFDIVTGEL